MGPCFSIFSWTEMMFENAQRMQFPYDTLLAVKPDGARFSIFSWTEMRYANAHRKQNPYETLLPVKNRYPRVFALVRGPKWHLQMLIRCEFHYDTLLAIKTTWTRVLAFVADQNAARKCSTDAISV